MADDDTTFTPTFTASTVRLGRSGLASPAGVLGGIMYDAISHSIDCRDAACERCAAARARRLDREFEEAGEDVMCDDCYHYGPPYLITDEVEEVVL